MADRQAETEERGHAEESGVAHGTSRPPRPAEMDDQAAAEAVIELPDSQAEPGGPPVRIDPAMVDAETAERMRPSADPRHR